MVDRKSGRLEDRKKVKVNWDRRTRDPRGPSHPRARQGTIDELTDDEGENGGNKIDKNGKREKRRKEKEKGRKKEKGKREERRGEERRGETIKTSAEGKKEYNNTTNNPK